MSRFDTFPDTRADGILASAAMAFRALAARRDRAMRELEAFRTRHAITGEPSVSDWIASVLLLALLTFGEGAVNAGFFLNAHMAATPLAALTTSLLISMTNVTACVTAGYFCGRYLGYGAKAADHDNPDFRGKRNLARSSAIAFGVVITWFHLSVGMIRAQERLDVVHSAAAYAEVLNTPDALFLVMIGAAFSVLAWFKGLTAFGTYPGYAPRKSAVESVTDEADDAYADFEEAIEDTFDEPLEDIEDSEGDLANLRDDLNEARADYRNAHAAFGQLVKTAEADLAADIALIINHYRAASAKKSPLPVAAVPRDFYALESEFPTAPLDVTEAAIPSVEARRRALSDAKAKALESLAQLYRQAFETDPLGDV